jgi:hypothetical protein
MTLDAVYVPKGDRRRAQLHRGRISKNILLSVTLRTQPCDAAVAIHPFVKFGFAFEPCDLNGLALWTFGQNIPVALGYSDGFESYFRFCHGVLCARFEGKSNRNNARFLKGDDPATRVDRNAGAAATVERERSAIHLVKSIIDISAGEKNLN